jgi:hypothetical protein
MAAMAKNGEMARQARRRSKNNIGMAAAAWRVMASKNIAQMAARKYENKTAAPAASGGAKWRIEMAWRHGGV